MSKEQPKSITVDVDTLNELIESKVQQRLGSLMSGSPNEQFQKHMDSLRGKDAPPLPETFYPCKSPITGATFNARVIASRTYPGGRVIDLPDYVHPPGADISIHDGGMVPAGMTIGSQDHKAWKYNEVWKRDLKDLVGKPFAKYYTVEEAARREALDTQAAG